MQDLNDKTLGGTLSATEWNEVPTEMQNIIEALGLTLSSGDLNQLGKAIAGYISNGNVYTDSGAANAHVLSVIGSKQRIPAYADGQKFQFYAAATNTGNATVNVGSLGVKDIRQIGGGTLPAGAIKANTLVTLIYNLAGDRMEIIKEPTAEIGDIILRPSSTVPAGYLECDGSAISRTTYASLFAVIGTTWGVGDGSTTFNLPDTRGEFIRGWDNGRGIDSGRVFASAQLDALQNITGNFSVVPSSRGDGTGGIHDATGVFSKTTSGGPNRGYNFESSGTGANHRINFSAAGSSGARTATETRARNLAMMFCIKY